MEFDQMIFLLDQFTKIQNSKSPGELAIIESSEKPTTEMLQFFLVYRIPIQSKEQTDFSQIAASWTHKLRFDKGHHFFFVVWFLSQAVTIHLRTYWEVQRWSMEPRKGGWTEVRGNPCFQLTNSPSRLENHCCKWPLPKRSWFFWGLRWKDDSQRNQHDIPSLQKQKKHLQLCVEKEYVSCQDGW